MSCWCTTRSSGEASRGKSAVGVALRVGEGDDEARAADRIEAGVGGQGVVAVLDRRERGVGARRSAVMGVDLGDELVALRAEPVHRLLGLPDQVDQPGRVAAPDLAAAGDPVRGRQQQPGQQADQRHAEAPAAGPRARLGTPELSIRSLSRRDSRSVRPTYVRLVVDSRYIVAPCDAECLRR